MVDNQLRVLQNELNRLVAQNTDYNKIYEVSVRLDELIVKHYTEKRQEKTL